MTWQFLTDTTEVLIEDGAPVRVCLNDPEDEHAPRPRVLADAIEALTGHRVRVGEWSANGPDTTAEVSVIEVQP